MTPHPARPVPQGADPQLAGMLGPLLDYLTEPDAESAPKPNGSPPSVSADHRPSCQSGAVTTTTTTCGEITAELVDIAEAEKITKWLLRAGHQRAADALLNDYPGPPSTLHVN